MGFISAAETVSFLRKEAIEVSPSVIQLEITFLFCLLSTMSEEGSLQKGSSLQKLGLEWLSGGLANALASAILNPMDVAKTRMQVMYNVSSSASTQKLNLRHYISLIYAEGGVIGLWRPGLSASMAREMLYSGPRAGFYVPIRDGLRRLMFNQSSSGQPDASLNDLLVLKVTAALITGQR